MPASLGSRWRLLRHYLSQTSAAGSPDHWEKLLRRIEKTITSRLITKSELDTVRSDSLTSESVTSDSRTSSDIRTDGVVRSADVIKSSPVFHSSSTTAKTTAGFEDVEKKQEASEAEAGSSEMVSAAVQEQLARPGTLGNLVEGVRLRADLALGRISREPQHRTQTQTSIHSRTAYVISALVAARSREGVRSRVDSFIQHLIEYPEARDYAIKEGGVRALLRVQTTLRSHDAPDAEIRGLVHEGLALLGHTGPCKGPGPNILSLDGGGIRGLVAIEILKQLERLSGRKVHELFDYMVGVSTGAIIAAVISSGAGNLDTASDMYHTLSKKMFGSTSLLGGTSRLVLTHSYYDTEAWESLLRERLDTGLTHCNRNNTPKMALVSCVVSPGSRLSPFLFRTYEMPFRVRSVFPGTARARVWQAVRASAAAPTYFAEFRHEGLLHQDGGIMVNNPSGIALHEAKLLFGPDALRSGCLVSIGTGRALAKLQADKPDAPTSWKDKFNKILDSATDTEGVHLVLNDLLPEGSYFRLNPPLNSEVAMDEISPDKLNNLISDTRAYMRRNRHKMQQAATMLTRRRGVLRRLGDALEHRTRVLGLRQAQ